MIEYVQGDLLAARTEALVNTVNTVGVMGAGLASQFKQRFPSNYAAYAIACRAGVVQPGRMFVCQTDSFNAARLLPRWIINFPTKRHWQDASRIEDIRAGLVALIDEIHEREIRSIAVPQLGCGYGGLSWKAVRPLIEAALAPLNVRVLVYGPGGPT